MQSVGPTKYLSEVICISPPPSVQATNVSLRESFDLNDSLWSGENFNLAEMSLTEFHTVLSQRLQCPDILPAWLGRAHCADDVPASSCLQAQPPAARCSVPYITGLSPPALGLPCCGRWRHHGTQYLSRHTEFRSDVWGHGQVDKEAGYFVGGRAQHRCLYNYFLVWSPLSGASRLCVGRLCFIIKSA